MHRTPLHVFHIRSIDHICRKSKTYIVQLRPSVLKVQHKKKEHTAAKSNSYVNLWQNRMICLHVVLELMEPRYYVLLSKTYLLRSHLDRMNVLWQRHMRSLITNKFIRLVTKLTWNLNKKRLRSSIYTPCMNCFFHTLRKNDISLGSLIKVLR